MKIFRPKHGPVLTQGRAIHFLEGLGVVFVAMLVAVLWGGSLYQGAAWGLIAVIVLAVLWEAATPLMAKAFHWSHPFGDIVDLISFLLGAIIPAGLVGVLLS